MSGDLDVVVGGVDPLPAVAVARAVGTVLAGEGRDAAISVTFLGPARMQQLNREHLGHDYPTDVISFALPQPDGGLTGDIYVCRHVAARQARAAGEPVRRELLRLVVHGTLHVLGREHPEDSTRVESTMWQLQERYLQGLM